MEMFLVLSHTALTVIGQLRLLQTEKGMLSMDSDPLRVRLGSSLDESPRPVDMPAQGKSNLGWVVKK